MTKTYFMLLIAMIVASVWTVIGRSLLKATIGLAITSAIGTILMFKLNSPLAAVFELSVCTGLITVVFVSTISLTKPLTHKEIVKMSKDRLKRFWYLPAILAVIGVCMLLFLKLKDDFVVHAQGLAVSVKEVLWNFRQLDLFGQILIIIIGALGVVILFEERRRDEW